LSFLRYSYIFLCLILGPLGFYFLIKHLFKNRLVAFISALFYLFNLGTLQQFLVPFEMFPTQWAFLPFIFLFSLKYLHHPTKFRLLAFGFLTLLSTPQAYAAQLWYAFFVVYTLFLILSHHPRLAFHLFIVTLFINSFWLLPNIYYTLTSSQNPINNTQNRLHSQEFLLQNRATGTLADTFLIKGFYFDWDEYNFTRKNSQPLSQVWDQHLGNIDVQIIGNILFLLSFTGLIIAFITKNKILISLSPIFIIPFLLLANSTPIIRIPFDLLLKIPLFQELFRFIFTKVSALFTFAVSLYLAVTLTLIFKIFKSYKTISIVLIISLFIYCYPYFQGQLISPIVRTQIPNQYFQLYQYLNQQNPGRILSLPLNEPTGWQYYSWGYQGSGFLWFGIPQSLLDRDSDRWEVKNEEAYREFYYSLYANNSARFFNSLHKYNVTYILWDQSVIPTSPKNRDQITFKFETQRLLDNSPLTLVKQFGSIYLYEVKSNTNIVKLQQITNFVSPAYQKSYFDLQYSSNDYLTGTSKDIIYPHRNFLTDTNTVNLSALDVASSSSFINYTATDLYPPKSTNTNLKIVNNSLRVSALNSTQGLELQLNLPHNQPYLLGLKTKYTSGLPLRFCFRNSYTGLCTIEDQPTKNPSLAWDYYLIPATDNDFDGYTLSLNSVSLAGVPSVNQISDLSISTLPLGLFATSNSTLNTPFPVSFKPIFPNNSLIKVSLNPSSPPDTYLTLYQSFSPGWLAISGNHLLPHVLVNNWANGWQISNISNQTIYILFWPQLLEFLGFGLLIATIIWIIRQD
ncbi:MAG: hypothetical protein NTY75_03195, partial [Candidatus Shapirobacteria bacterium]|nr:hypothetical protein [Candidatus Shapirobacteria bacterium]